VPVDKLFCYNFFKRTVKKLFYFNHMIEVQKRVM